MAGMYCIVQMTPQDLNQKLVESQRTWNPLADRGHVDTGPPETITEQPEELPEGELVDINEESSCDEEDEAVLK